MTLYTIYKTTNLVNGKYYFGVHKTKNPYDGYLGSGTYIKRAIAKYGEQNFRKEVLFIYLDPESAFGKEDELIQCYRGRDQLCMNLRKGGSGGFDFINREGISGYRKGVISANKNRLLLLKTDSEFSSQFKCKIKEGLRQKHASDQKFRLLRVSNALKIQSKAAAAWKGKTHSKDSLKRMSESHRGNKNHCFGTIWVRHDDLKISKRIKLCELEIYTLDGWSRGRKFY